MHDEEIVEKQPELTPEQKAEQEQQEKDFYTLKAKIESLIDEVYKLDIPVAAIEIHADDLFRNYRRIKASKSKQWDEFVKEKVACESKFYSLKAHTLEEMPYVPTTETKEVTEESNTTGV